ncbi:hypothetical protein CIW54_07890 [Paraburkholderia sp. T12-10]|nr:hypothetical protein CIW54_07890 [Paraburkholderia sp. T12-10]
MFPAEASTSTRPAAFAVNVPVAEMLVVLPPNVVTGIHPAAPTAGATVLFSTVDMNAGPPATISMIAPIG